MVWPVNNFPTNFPMLESPAVLFGEDSLHPSTRRRATLDFRAWNFPEASRVFYVRRNISERAGSLGYKLVYVVKIKSCEKPRNLHWQRAHMAGRSKTMSITSTPPCLKVCLNNNGSRIGSRSSPIFSSKTGVPNCVMKTALYYLMTWCGI